MDPRETHPYSRALRYDEPQSEFRGKIPPTLWQPPHTARRRLWTEWKCVPQSRSDISALQDNQDRLLDNFRGLFILGNVQGPLPVDEDMFCAKRLIADELVLLADSVNALREIYTEIKSTAAEILRLTKCDISNTDRENEVLCHSQDVEDVCSKAAERLIATGVQQFATLTNKMLQYNEKTTKESNVLATEAKLCRKLSPPPAYKRLGFIASSVRRIAEKCSTQKDSKGLDVLQRRVTAVLKEIKVIGGLSCRAHEMLIRVHDCELTWKAIQEAIWDDPSTNFNQAEIMNRQNQGRILMMLTGRLEVLMNLSNQMNRLLGELDEHYGPAACINTKIDAFRERLKGISNQFDRLSSIQNLVQKKHQEIVLNEVRQLARCTEQYLLGIQNVISSFANASKTSLPPIDDVCDLAKDTPHFQLTYGRHCREICSLLEKNVNVELKAKDLGDGRPGKGDPSLVCPLVSAPIGLSTMAKLEAALYAISQFSNSFTIEFLRFSVCQNANGVPNDSTNIFVLDAAKARNASHVINIEAANLRRVLQRWQGSFPNV